MIPPEFMAVVERMIEAMNGLAHELHIANEWRELDEQRRDDEEDDEQPGYAGAD